MIRKVVLVIITIVALNLAGKSQDTWYLWIDTYADINAVNTRIVSEEPFAITCCLQSGKYRRFLKKTAQWIRKNVDKNYNKSNALKNIQDLSFAMDMIADAKRNKEAGDKIKFIKFSAICEY